jgi:hypothetical protein
MATMYKNVCDNCVGRIESVDISLTVHSRAILKIIKSMCNSVIKKIKCTHMKCDTTVNSNPPRQLPHKSF